VGEYYSIRDGEGMPGMAAIADTKLAAPACDRLALISQIEGTHRPELC